MKEYNLCGVVTVSVYTTVEAESLEEAIKIAEERSDSIDKMQWKDHRKKEMWLVDGFDGLVQEITES